MALTIYSLFVNAGNIYVILETELLISFTQWNYSGLVFNWIRGENHLQSFRTCNGHLREGMMHVSGGRLIHPYLKPV